MTEALDAIQKAGGSIQSVFTSMEDKVDRVLNPEQIERMLNGVDDALNSFSETMDSVTELINSPELRHALGGGDPRVAAGHTRRPHHACKKSKQPLRTFKAWATASAETSRTSRA